METKVTPNRADNIINRLSRFFRFHFKFLSTGFTGGLWVLWESSPISIFDILFHQDRFIHGLNKDFNINACLMVNYFCLRLPSSLSSRLSMGPNWEY